jgi:hypothetical protein
VERATRRSELLGRIARYVSIVLGAAILLTGCGGGGSSSAASSASQSTAGQAQGVYSGTSSTGYYFESIVLPTDVFYALYGNISGNVFFVSGMMTGQGASKNGTYTASVKDFYLTSPMLTGSVTASYVVGTSLNGTVVENGTTISFTGAPFSSSNYNYNTAAVVSTITGTWSGHLLDGTSATVTINSNGTFTGSNLGCLFTGTVVPDPSGKNFFDVTIQFGASPCVLANQTSAGNGLTYLLSNGTTRQLLFAGTSGNFGTVFFAAK